HINAAWNNAELGFTWNDEPYYRSYWAQTATGNYATEFTYNSLSNEVNNFDYCLENINDSKRTQVVIAAKLYTDEACTQEAKIARLYSDMYLLDDLKTVIANALADHYFYKADETTYKSIEPTDIDLVAAGQSGKESYTVKYILSTQGVTRDWYYTDDAGKSYTQKSDDEMNAYLATLEGAQVWNGMSYYMVDIEHLGNNSITNYGVVRNHSYVITVEGISGLGTPVYDPNNNVTEPVDPVETTSFVSARINVLSWRIVNQNVTLQ
ncbi:MAG: Mfa1 fimbrilin C-terminal domain-containing protein, partial [Bacteroidaceae bacterium]|nr:Mfa1 fimbrilin C-terminal domain-containing protein [Bacteroidaceae bacterium]